MKILVPVKAAARIDGEPAFAGPAAVSPDLLEWDLNEWDAFSLEAALQLAEAEGGSEVLVATVGGEQAEDALMSCLAKGADRAVRIWDDVLDGADPLAVASVLAGLAAREHPDLILAGVQSSDAANAATAVALAGLLDLPRVAVVRKIEREGGKLTVHRELDGGAVEVLSVAMPALLTIQTGINEPRYATLRAIKQARSKPLEVLGLPEAGTGPERVRDAAGSQLVRLEIPAIDETAEMLAGSAGEVAERIAEIVKEELRA